MIIFDLDGTLADCEHRRHFVDPIKAGYSQLYNTPQCFYSKRWVKFYGDEPLPREFKPNWDAFYKACHEDSPITPVINIFESIGEACEYGSDTPWVDYDGVEIWSGRCESERRRTEKWFKKHIKHYHEEYPKLKMRPVGDSTPDDVLKEKWLDEAIANGKKIEFVFDDRPKVVRMWRRRGIFVFNCNQSDEEF